MRKIDVRPCFTNIYIVCEGSKSEPWFLLRYIEWIKGQGIDTDYECDIYPTPKEEEDDDAGTADNKTVKRSSRKNSGRRVKDTSVVAEKGESPRGGNPLYWVEHGISKQDSYSEVYVVFDKDGHPKMEDAYRLARDAEKVRIILNSRSFEYYMLLHFENIYRAFAKTECGEKRGGHTRSYHCCLPTAVIGKECGGAICINGYARSKGYWYDSKDENTFQTASNLWRGMSNGEDVRTRALNANPGKQVFELNPYVESQALLARLMGMGIFRTGDTIGIDSGKRAERLIKRNAEQLEITNKSSSLTIKLNQGWLEYYTYPEQAILFEDFAKEYDSRAEALHSFSHIQGDRALIHRESGIIVEPEESRVVNLFEGMPDNTFAVMTLGTRHYLIFRS